MSFLVTTAQTRTVPGAFYVMILILGVLLIAWELRQLLQKEGAPAKKLRLTDLPLLALVGANTFYCLLRFFGTPVYLYQLTVRMADYFGIFKMYLAEFDFLPFLIFLLEVLLLPALAAGLLIARKKGKDPNRKGPRILALVLLGLAVGMMHYLISPNINVRHVLIDLFGVAFGAEVSIVILAVGTIASLKSRPAAVTVPVTEPSPQQATIPLDQTPAYTAPLSQDPGQGCTIPLDPNPGHTIPLDPNPGHTVPLDGAAAYGATAPLTRSVFSLRCLSGPMEGQVFPVPFSYQSEVLLGRAYHCDVRFPAETAGVSGVHCKVTVTMHTGSSSIMLADQGSTYGTFLQDGTQVTQPVWLKSGDVFFLSEGGPALRVERSMEA